MFDPKQFARTLKKYRKFQSMTQSDVARELCVTPQSVSKWERGEVIPDVVNLCALSKLLSVSLDMLLQNRSADLRGLIGIDGGATKTEFVLIDESGRCLNTIVLEGCNANTCGVEKTVEILRRGIDFLRPQEMNVVGVYLGGAGMASGNNADVVRTALRKAYPNLAVGCANDISNVIACGENPELCIAAISGTGSVVYSNRGGQLRRFGGTGYLFEGGGSGYDVGRDAIAATLRVGDGLEKATRLTELVEQRLGGPVWDSIQDLYRRDTSYIASFSTLVAQAAEEDDPVALQILRRNAEHMARLICAAHRQNPEIRHVVLSGSLFAKNDRFFHIVAENLDPQLTVERVTCPPVWGACLQCARMCQLQNMPSRDEFMRSRTDSARREQKAVLGCPKSNL